ncbi:MAG TPA: MauE/DoxX family redox-associated membrane protein [Candidatus Limnocylindria bacterium]|jgi:thiol-disulfide isomerase/thioredoxin|nr:MauE/DoxX family redox-associated membrane protein [Candidatus Limnocylindria bacterium]
MDSVVLAARLLLTIVFVVAAVGKFMDLRGSRASLVGFGVPEGLANPLGTLLPFLELAVAIALVPRPTATAGAIGAVVLLTVFVAGVSNALRKGEAPPCNCFGAIHSEPASPRTLVRNAALAVVAIVALAWGPGPAIDTWVSDRTAAELVAVFTTIALLAALAIGVPLWIEARRLRGDLERAEDRLGRMPPGLPVGSLAPEFSFPNPDGTRTSLSSLLERGRPVVLIFAAAGCGPCEPMLEDLQRLQSIAQDRVSVAIVGLSTFIRYDAYRQEQGGSALLMEATAADPILQEQMDELVEIAHLYDVHHSPAALVVTPSGTIGSALVEARPGIEALIRLAIADAAPMAVPVSSVA